MVTSNGDNREIIASVFLLNSASYIADWMGFIAWGPDDGEMYRLLHSGLSGERCSSEISA